jgi:hypothetical protein
MVGQYGGGHRSRQPLTGECLLQQDQSYPPNAARKAQAQENQGMMPPGVKTQTVGSELQPGDEPSEQRDASSASQGDPK